MEVQNMSINDIKPYDNNPRDNDNAVESTANSIKEFGWQQPIVVDKDMVIIVGHTRYKAAKKLGYKEVPVVVASNLNKEQVRAYRLADNKTGELANWVYGDLMSEIQEIQDLDLTDFGFNDSDLDISDKWEDNASLDDYEEPDTSNFEPKKCICPKCGYLGNEEEFKV
jgi:site-specific DNA-methyltransferase (adenine-specific)